MRNSSATGQESSSFPTAMTATPWALVWLPFLFSLVALFGSLWLSVGMSLKACPLCLYQRTFVMGVVGVLGVGTLVGGRYRGVVPLLALPSAVGGLGVAVFQEYLELTGKLECPGGVMGFGTSPQQSLAVQFVVLLLVIGGTIHSLRIDEIHWSSVVGAMVLGVLLAVGAVVSAPPMPAPPTKAYETPLEICRPPYRP